MMRVPFALMPLFAWVAPTAGGSGRTLNGVACPVTSQCAAVDNAGDEVTAAKPDPAPIIAAMEMLSVKPAVVLFVGDGANDVIAAHSAGIRVVGAGYGFHPEACRAAGPDHWIEAPLDLVAIVGSIRAATSSSTV